MYCGHPCYNNIEWRLCSFLIMNLKKNSLTVLGLFPQISQSLPTPLQISHKQALIPLYIALYLYIYISHIYERHLTYWGFRMVRGY
ncbi:hypothetical protein L6452_31908 [Arctium lappa]|uniref:Uncharacterized protein n=1 Tax=Arctium lappa TaxID=4217 RepID=A0ACB8Z298_ARCLA|nr:hypothetical protein L6452_31908 [Arctium lappa]